MTARGALLELAILDICLTPSHGYKIRKALTIAGGPFDKLSFGSIYPALHRLHSSELLEEMDESLVTIPPSENQDPGRGRKYYQTTSNGRDYLLNRVSTVETTDQNFTWQLRLFKSLTDASRLSLLHARLSQLTQRIAQLDEQLHNFNLPEDAVLKIHATTQLKCLKLMRTEVEELAKLMQLSLEIPKEPPG